MTFNALASASVGQVHLAELMDGSKVVVKVQHAGIEAEGTQRPQPAGLPAQMAEKNSRELAYYRPSATVTQFSRSLMRELDFRIELNNLLAVRAQFCRETRRPHPARLSRAFRRAVCWSWSGCEGYSIAKRDRMLADGVDCAGLRRSVCQHDAGHDLSSTASTMPIPTPATSSCLPEGRLGLLDCGKVGRVDEQTQDAFISIVTAFIGRDVEALTDELTSSARCRRTSIAGAYHADVAEFVGEFADTPSGKLDMAAAFNAMFAIIRKYHLHRPGTRQHAADGHRADGGHRPRSRS